MKKLNHAICLSVVIRFHGQIGRPVQLLASLVDRLVVMDGLVVIKMMFLKLDHVKLVMDSIQIGLHGMHALKLVQVVISSVFDLTHVVNLMSVVLDVNLPKLKPVDLMVNGHYGLTIPHALQLVQMAQWSVLVNMNVQMLLKMMLPSVVKKDFGLNGLNGLVVLHLVLVVLNIVVDLIHVRLKLMSSNSHVVKWVHG
jgi:hypothetical protein